MPIRFDDRTFQETAEVLFTINPGIKTKFSVKEELVTYMKGMAERASKSGEHTACVGNHGYCITVYRIETAIVPGEGTFTMGAMASLDPTIVQRFIDKMKKVLRGEL